MWRVIENLKQKPEPVRRKIFIVSMAVFFVVLCALYLFSIKNSIAYSLKSASGKESVPGEFHLPGVSESIGASVKDVIKSIKE